MINDTNTIALIIVAGITIGIVGLIEIHKYRPSKQPKVQNQ